MRVAAVGVAAAVGLLAGCGGALRVPESVAGGGQSPGHAAGEAVVAPVVVPPQTPMLRGIWVDTWDEGMLTREQCDQLVADVRAANLNAIFAQVRKVGDAYYAKGFEPRAANLADDDFDPLAYLIERCHDTTDGKAYIQVHAWLVVLRVWKTELGEPPVGHLLAEHPATVMSNARGETVGGTSVFVDPGHPMTQEWTTRVFRQLVENYAVDGVHHDYVRYPEFDDDWGHNPVSLERYRQWTGTLGIPAADDPSWQAWRRDQVAALLRRVYAEVTEARPGVAVSAATVNWGMEIDPWTWADSRPRMKAHQDWPRYMAEGSLDINVLMNYAPESLHAGRFADWASLAMRTRGDRWTVLGTGMYLNPVEDTVSQVHQAQAMGADGVALYSYRATNNEGADRAAVLGRLTAAAFPQPVPVPPMPWKADPRHGIIMGRVTDGEAWADGAMVSIDGGGEQFLRADATGFYAFLRVDPGTHTVRVHDPRGFADQTVTVSPGRATRADFELAGLQAP